MMVERRNFPESSSERSVVSSTDRSSQIEVSARKTAHAFSDGVRYYTAQLGTVSSGLITYSNVDIQLCFVDGGKRLKGNYKNNATRTHKKYIGVEKKCV